jgi:hypothetical protein
MSSAAVAASIATDSGKKCCVGRGSARAPTVNIITLAHAAVTSNLVMQSSLRLLG